jgi:hypothetical protein
LRRHEEKNELKQDDSFWDIAPCSLFEIADVSEVRSPSIIRAMMAEGVRAFKTSVYFEATGCYMPEG